MGVTDRLRRLDERARVTAPSVPDDQWMSFQDAAVELGIAEYRLAGPLAAGNLRKASNAAGVEGVTRASVATEADWRRTASFFARVRRVVAVWVSFLLP